MMKKIAILTFVLIALSDASIANAQGASNCPIDQGYTLEADGTCQPPLTITPQQHTTNGGTGGTETGNGTNSSGNTSEAGTNSKTSNTNGQNLGYTPLEPIVGVTTGAGGTQLDFPTLLSNLYIILITVGALFSVVMITISGVRYMLSEIVTEKSEARERIEACLWGLLLLAGSYLILHTINPTLTQFSLTPCPTAANCTITGPTPAAAPAPAPVDTSPIACSGDSSNVTYLKKQVALYTTLSSKNADAAQFYSGTLAQANQQLAQAQAAVAACTQAGTL